MTSTTPLPTSPPDGRRAGATWVAATGAFLLLASATVFVAVRWDRLPEEAKVALVGGLTGGFLVGGRALRRTLPATGEVLFHLGALLIPVDVAALSLRLDLGWRHLLLAEGLVGVGVLGALAAAAGSVVLTAAAGLAVVALAAGIAAVSPVPGPLVLAAAAVGAHLLGRRRPSIVWAAGAGLAPVLGAAATGLLGLIDARASGFPGALGRTGPAVLEELGLAGSPAATVAVATGLVTAVVLGREATRRHDLALVAVAGACVASGAATTWANADPSASATLVAAPALFLLVQVVTMLFQRDAFWSRPARAVALAAEVVAGVVATPVAFALLLAAPFADDGFDLFSDSPGWRPQPAAAVGWALLAGGWLLAAWRRSGPPDRPVGERVHASPLDALCGAVADGRTVVFLAAAAGAAVVVGSASTLVIGAALVVLAAGLIASRGVGATVVGAVAAAWAPAVVGLSHPAAALPVGVAAAFVLGLAAVARRGNARGWATTGLVAAASTLAFFSCAVAAGEVGRTVAMLVAVASAWALGLLVERASPMAGHVARAAMLLGTAAALGGTTVDGLVVAAVATLLFAFDAARHDDPFVGLGAALTIQAVVVTAALGSDLDLAATGVVLCGTAVVFTALSALYPARWRLPFVAAAAAALLAGLPLAGGDGARFAEALILGGGLAVAAGLILRNGGVGHAGGAVTLLGLGLHLVVDGVTVLEAFAGPVALHLAIAGWQLRHAGPADPSGPATSSAAGRDARPWLVSSWVAYGPAIGLLGAAGLAERLSGGEAWHGLLVGAVGVAAVAVGGWRRLAGPLFLGTALIAVTATLESLATLAGVPTWAWLAVGGTTLLTTGVALERSATSPIEAGRRLVDVVDERFS